VLAATFPPGVILPARWSVIGRVTAGRGVLVDGRTWAKAGGWEHFRAQLRNVSEAILYVTRRNGHLLDITTLMPRHRAEDLPRHSAKRQGFWPGRSAWTIAARMRGAGGATRAAEPAHARRARRWARPGARAEYRRIVRGAMLTPWFAVSVGIVIAISLTLAAPHPALSFPPSKSGSCALVECGVVHPVPDGRHAAAKREDRLPSPAPEQSAVTVEYAEQPMHKGQFMAVIVIIGHHPLKHWTLEFAWPGAHISSIWWARWNLEGTDGFIVRGSPLPWPRSGANEARIVIAGAGTPDRPSGCVFDSAPCTFRALNETPRHGRWPFGR
jgi:hypothetical protein